ncbi:hypothetical protein AXK33_25675 [Escherichia coli]|nr:hypothetical protein AXK33_25675 [Escherichia coli]
MLSYQALVERLQAGSAVEAVAQAMRSPVTLEYDLDDAGRGHRDRALAQLLCRITGGGRCLYRQ